jgi:hypothetical protein
MLNLFDTAKKVAGFLIVILALVGAWAVWDYFFGDDVSEKAVSIIVAADKAEKLVTGYAYVSIMRVRMSGNKILEDWKFAKLAAKDRTAQGLCLRLYKVAFGYESYSDAQSQFSSTSPERLTPIMLAVEAVQAGAVGEFSEVLCDRFDEVEDPKKDARKEVIKRRLMLDGLLRAQYEQGCRVIDSLAAPAENAEQADVEKKDVKKNDVGAESETPDNPRLTRCLKHVSDTAAQEGRTSEIRHAARPVDNLLLGGELARAAWYESFRKQAPVRNEVLGGFAGAIGSLTVTISTIGEVAYNRPYFFFWKSPEFYVRRDITVATYGSYVRRAVTRGILKTKLVVDLEEPSVIARDRRMDFSVASARYDRTSAPGDPSRAEQNVVSAVNWALEDIDRDAKRLAKVYLRGITENRAKAYNASSLQLTFQ